MKYLNEIIQEIQNEKLQNKPEESQSVIENIYNEVTIPKIKENETLEDPKQKPKLKFTKRKILFYIILTLLITIAIKIIPGGI